METARPSVSTFARCLAVLAVLLAVVCRVSAAEATVTGTLSSVNTTAGEDVLYQLRIQNGSPDRFPDFPKIDGVEIDFGGRNSSLSFVNGVTNQSIVYSYRLTPKREGNFEIPPVDVIVDGKKFTTAAVTLKVGPPEKSAGGGDIAYGESSVVRQPAYVGEDVVLELRYYFYNDPNDRSTPRWSFSGAQLPGIEGEGFSARNVVPADQSSVTVGGKKYYRFLFRAVVTPNRAGSITIGPVSFNVQVSRGTRNQGFGMIFESTRQYAVSAPALNLEVKPLPAEGRPKDFAGAIGDFRFSGQGTPARVKFGDPITMTLRVEGNGNFDRIGAPALTDPTGWRAYKPTEKFAPGDPLSVSGSKTFQIAVVPDGKKTSMPVFNFSYFNPEKAKYITLTTSPAPLEVEGAPAPAAPVAPEPGASKPKPAADDILGIRPAPGFWGVGWQPRLSLWFALLIAPAPLIAFALFWRARRTDPQAAIRSGLHREKSSLLHRLRTTSDRTELFDVAARILQIDVALATGQPSAGIDEATVLARCDSAAVKKMYAARAEMVYAGESGGKVTANERDQILDAIADFERSRR